MTTHEFKLHTQTLIAALFAIVLWHMPTASAQLAGNEHPDAPVVSGDDRGEHPFGDPSPRSGATPEQKAEFEAQLDLSPLADLAVLHGGRVKILDTLAKETVRALTGRSRYAELVSPEGGQADQVPEGMADEAWRYGGDRAALDTHKFSPMFTLIDLAVDPAYYADRPLIAIEYLPLRREMLDMAFPGDGADAQRTRSVWLSSTRVSPRMVSTYATPIYNRHQAEEPFRQGISEIESARDLFLHNVANWNVVAPDSTTDEWHHLAELPAGDPARVAARDLGDAWRAMDATAANDAIARLAEVLPAINPEIYPESRRSLELFYNRAHAFDIGLWAYLLSFVALVLAFATGRGWLTWAGVGLFAVGLAAHATGFVLRCMVAERFAIQNQFESMTGVSLFGAIVGLGLMLWKRQYLFGAAAAGAGFLILIAASLDVIPGKEIGREAAILNTSVLLKYHVTTVLTSYALITLGMIVSLFYLGTHYGAKLFGTSEMTAVSAGAVGSEIVTDNAPKPALARTLKDLDTAQMTVLQLAFWTLGVGTLLGAWWADHSWGRWWAFDPKETWALVTWIVYLIVIHVRFMGLRDKGLTTAWLSVVGFLVMLWTYFGVNLLLPGLHAYA